MPATKRCTSDVISAKDWLEYRSDPIHEVRRTGRRYLRLVKDRTIEERSKWKRILNRLQRTVAAGNTHGFVSALNQVEWEDRSAEDFSKLIRLALNVGAPTAANYIYEEGVKRHPYSPALGMFARLFSPPKRTKRTLDPNPTLKANREWLDANREAYSGNWIALQNGQLLGTAHTLEDLTRQFGNTSNVLLTKA